MFLKTIISEMSQHQKPYEGKPSSTKLFMMPMETLEDRLMLLLNIASYCTSLGISVMPDGRNAVPSLQKIRQCIVESMSMSHNRTIVAHDFTVAMQELSFEIMEATNNKPDFSKVGPVFTGEIPVHAFLDIPQTVTFHNKIYSWKGASGTEYAGVGIVDIAKYDTEQIIDILKGAPLDAELRKITDYAIEHADIMKDAFKNHRMGLLPILKYWFDPASQESKIVEFVKGCIKEDEERTIANTVPTTIPDVTASTPVPVVPTVETEANKEIKEAKKEKAEAKTEKKKRNRKSK